MADAPDQPELSSFASLDLGRSARRGYPEAIYCSGKTPEQVAVIGGAVRHRPDLVTLFTRAGPAHVRGIVTGSICPDIGRPRRVPMGRPQAQPAVIEIGNQAP